MQERIDLTLFSINDAGEITWPREKYPDFEKVALHLQAKCHATQVAQIKKDIINKRIFLLPKTSSLNHPEAFIYICFASWLSVLWQYISIVVINGKEIIFDSNYYSAQELATKLPLETLATLGVQVNTQIIANRLFIYCNNMTWVEELLRLFMLMRPQFIKFVSLERIESPDMLAEKMQLIDKIFASPERP